MDRIQAARIELAKRELARRGVDVSRGTSGRRVQDIPESEFTPPNLLAETARGTMQTLGRSFREDIASPVQSMMRNPLETAAGLGNLARGVFQMTPQGAPLRMLPGGDAAQGTVSQVGENYRQAYGSPESFAQTVAEHPFRFVSDATMIAGGAGAGMRATGVPSLVKAGSFPATAAAVKAGGAAVGKAATSVVKAPVNAVKFGAERTIGSMIKPLLKDFSYGKNPTAVAYEKIKANNWDDWIKKLGQRQDEIGREANNLMSKSSARIDTGPGIDLVFKSAIQKAASQNNKTLVDRLGETYRAITENLEPAKTKASSKGVNIGIKSTGRKKLNQMTPVEAWELKKKIGELAKWTERADDDRVVNTAIQNAYRVVKKKLEIAVPGVKQLNERYANVTSAKVASIYRDKILQRHDIMGPLPTKLLAGLEILSGQASPESVLKGIAIVGVGKFLASPYAKTRLAAALAKLSEVEKIKVFNVYPQLKALSTKLQSERGSVDFSPDNTNIPDFKNTGDAVRFGYENRNNQNILLALKNRREEMRAQAKSLMDAGKEDEAFILTQKAQFPREALEAAEGKIKLSEVERIRAKIVGKQSPGGDPVLTSALAKQEKQDKLMGYYEKLKEMKEKSGNKAAIAIIQKKIEKIALTPEEQAAIYKYHSSKD